MSDTISLKSEVNDTIILNCNATTELDNKVGTMAWRIQVVAPVAPGLCANSRRSDICRAWNNEIQEPHGGRCRLRNYEILEPTGHGITTVDADVDESK